MIAALATVVFLGAMATAAFTDLTRYEIPNWISLVAVAAYCVGAAGDSSDVGALAWHMGVGFAVLAAGFGLFALGVFGGGDAKLLAAAALWFGPALLLKFVILVALAGGVLGVAILCLRRLSLPPKWAEKPWVRGLFAPDQGMPYGVAIAFAAGLMYAQPLLTQYLTANGAAS